MQNYKYYQTKSEPGPGPKAGTIHYEIKGAILVGLTLDFSATDGRKVPPKVSQDQLLWSSVVKKTVPPDGN